MQAADGRERGIGRAVRHAVTAAAVVGVAAMVALGVDLWWPSAWSGGSTTAAGRIVAVGAESQYANVIAQVGGDQVQVTAVMSNPTTDPHTFEASPAVAQVVGSAGLVVQNGLGYDAFMTTVERASASSTRRVIDVQRLLGLPDRTPNPHLWYTPATMPAVAKAVAQDLAALDPAHRELFADNLTRFDQSLGTWTRDIASLAAAEPGVPVATTEPVADDLLDAVGARNLTPFSFQTDVMNGLDPSPQDVAAEEQLLTRHEVAALVYNRQVTDTLTESLLSLARRSHVPVVGVYETMPTPGYDYQTWMQAEVRALHRALTAGTSSPTR